MLVEKYHGQGPLPHALPEVLEKAKKEAGTLKLNKQEKAAVPIVVRTSAENDEPDVQLQLPAVSASTATPVKQQQPQTVDTGKPCNKTKPKYKLETKLFESEEPGETGYKLELRIDLPQVVSLACYLAIDTRS